MTSYVLSHHFEDTRSHEIVDNMSQYFVDSLLACGRSHSGDDECTFPHHTGRDYQLRPYSHARFVSLRFL